MTNSANGRLSLKLNNSVLVQKKTSLLYISFILNSYILFELNKWPLYPTNNVTLKNCLFGKVKLTINAGKSTFTYNGRGISFDGNVVLFCVDNISSSHTDDNKKNNFLVLSEGPTEGINGSLA